jgi:hypothetical protein
VFSTISNFFPGLTKVAFMKVDPKSIPIKFAFTTGNYDSYVDSRNMDKIINDNFNILLSRL